MRKSLVMGLILVCSAGVTASERDFESSDALPGFVIGARENEPCPADAITGQIPSACGITQWYFYSDLNFSSGTQSVRVRCEDFPKTGVLDPNDPNDAIGTIIWSGVNIDANSNGCTKGTPGTYQFRIRFYNDNAGAPNPAFVYEEIVTPTMTDTGETVLFSGATVVAIRWKYTAMLTTPRHMARGWFSICGLGSPTCWSMWEGSGTDGGDNKFYNWWEVNGTIPGPAVTTLCDLSYCFGIKTIGACCVDCETCMENVAEVVCRTLGGRYHGYAPCSSFGDPNYPSDPNCPNVACGQALGACCHNDGVCVQTTCRDCVMPEPQPCRGDADCDGDVDWDDLSAEEECVYYGTCCSFYNCDCDGNGVINEDDLLCMIGVLGQPCPQPPPRTACPGDCNCDGLRNFDDIDCFVASLGGAPCCDGTGANCDINGDGVVNFDDINGFIALLGVPCSNPPPPSHNIWLGVCSSCNDCCTVQCTDPNQGVTHPELEPCGQNTNDGCNALVDPNDPNSPVDPNAWEDLGVLSSITPTVICGTLWADNGTRDTDWYKFTLPIQGTLTWETQSDIPLLSTPAFGNGTLTPPTIAAQCHGGPLWGYFNEPRSYPCTLGGIAAPDIFPGGPTYWWIAFPDSGSAIFYDFPCSAGWNNYRISITHTPLTCNPCLPTDIQEAEPGCWPGYVDTFNAGCDAASGFPVQAQLDPNVFYCGSTGTWTDPNGNSAVDFDWWKIVLTGTVNKRLQIQVRAAFNLQYELYSVPSEVCADKVRLDYYEFDACESNVTITTLCLPANGAVYYLRFSPFSNPDCTQFNTYRFLYSVVTEAPSCTVCAVTCTAEIDDACQSYPTDPETNAGCNAANPNNPANYMPFTPGDNTYGPKYCGRLSTFTGSNGTPQADLDWFRFTEPPSRHKLVIRVKAMFRISVTLSHGCIDPNSITHGWDRPCKGTTTAATQTYTGLTPNTVYTGVITYGNGGGDGTGEQPLKQFFFGLPCTDNRNTYELELNAQT